MNSKDSVQKFENTMSAHVSWLASQLESQAQQKSLSGSLSSGCWSNENGLLVGWVGYLPHNKQHEETIELVFTLSSSGTKNGKGKLDIGIYWSDGSLIQEIAKFDDVDINGSVMQIDSIIEQFKSKILFEMVSEMSIDRPPYYRKD